MKFLLFIVLLFSFFGASAVSSNDTLLSRLNSIVEKKSDYDKQKLKRIANLESQLASASGPGPAFLYQLYLNLYNEYKTFNYDKAFYYSLKIQETGRNLNDPVKIAYGKIKLGFVLLSSGMFKETFDSLRTVNVGQLPDSVRMEYYFLSARTYYDLADFDKDNYYAPIYNKRAHQYIDSATALCKPRSYDFQYYTGLRLLKMGDSEKATQYLRNLLDHYPLTNHELAVTASTLSDIYIQKGNTSEAIKLLIEASIADIKSSTKEAAAMLNLAQLLHKNGDVKNSYDCINEAMDDATYYGARQRKVQVSAILMVIAGEKINSVEEQRRVLFWYASLVTGLTLIIVVFAFIIYRQLKKLRKADKIIVETNLSLQDTIRKLKEAETIKEEYIGYYFNLISEYINKLEKFKRSVDNKLISRRFDDIQVLVNNINLKKEREELFANFDRAFLTIFPNFVEAFNALFDEENQIKLQPHQLLNTDLRIFALVRLGISDTEKIANILEYSLNTIYNYKARIKGKSKLPNDDFEDAVLAIQAIS